MVVTEVERAEARASHLRRIERTVSDAVARILADAEHDVAERRAHRGRWPEECPGVVRSRPRKKTL